jgi:hypothetical protein
MSLFTRRDAEKLAQEALDPEKVILTCGIHQWSYGQRNKLGEPVPPHFNCRQCEMVSFMGLLSNTPPDRRQETVEMLEYSIHKLIEAEKRGEINKETLFKRPEVSIERNVN